MIKRRFCLFLSILIIFFISYDNALLIENGSANDNINVAAITSTMSVSAKPSAILAAIPTIAISKTPIPNTPTPSTKTKEKIKEVKGLVELLKLDNTFVIDIKYATKDNFTKKIIYPSAKCIINKNTAAKLIKANNEFKKMGYRIKIYDAYRPHSAQKVLWDAASDKSFVADPKKGSNHNRGAAVDVTLVDKYGKEVRMPSGYDEFTKRAKLDYKDCPKEQINNRELLGRVMVKYGFKRIRSEWWHFDDSDAKKYQVLDISFSNF
ncbi:MAG TPA: D-alanyl-D-alanine dipeptidase [Pseudobacteroides sp.]|uniref:D-alanyl-D-alanine dipeptidase n=1 Tax=Pseudobacteroides sp. TaxID=1968840 RepID=UPI002F95600B